MTFTSLHAGETQLAGGGNHTNQSKKNVVVFKNCMNESVKGGDDQLVSDKIQQGLF